jgi:hypothetical protein
MKYATMKNKVLASLLGGVLAPTLALAAVATLPVIAQAEVKKARCDVHAVLAAKDGDGSIPANLKFLEARLREDDFAAYKSFQLVEKKSAKATLEKAAEFAFSSGNRLTLGLLGSEDTRLKLRASLFSSDGEKKLLSTDYSIVDGGVLMLGGVEHTEKDVTGKLFFAVQCARQG